MALNWRPVGPDPEQVYWQRRAVVAVAAGVSLFILIFLLSRAFGSGDTVQAGAETSATPARTADASPSAAPMIGPTAGSPSPGPTPSGAVAACAQDAVELGATVERDSYPVGGRPRLTLTVTNTGSTPCTRDLGQAAVGLTVFSGADRIWSSDDCAPGGPASVKTLAPGKPEKVGVTWAAKRSQPKCAGDQAQAEAGTYRVSGRVGDQKVEGDTFRFTE